METSRFFILMLIFCCCLTSNCNGKSFLRMLPENSDLISDGNSFKGDNNLYCSSWKFTVETNDAGPWSKIPARCFEYIKDYLTGDRYKSDSEAVAYQELSFIRTNNFFKDGTDAWIFDIDETLLSNLPYYVDNGFRYDTKSYDEWVDKAEAPALEPSLKVYKELEQVGVKIFLLTGRDESQRNQTEKNLVFVGYSNWEKLILRGESDLGKPAIVYKSEKRKEIEDAGYVLHGNSGDQWSDLMGFSIATRSFKLPNPMYFIA